MLSLIVLHVIILNVIVLCFIILSIIVKSVIMLSLIVPFVIMLSVFAAQYDAELYCILCHYNAFLLVVIVQRIFVHTVTVLDSRS
jgi:hypothetical protein